jgi:two-component system, response regulator PdtaR
MFLEKNINPPHLVSERPCEGIRLEAPAKITILIVEDEGLIALDLKRKLEQAGYTVVIIVDNAADAIQSVDELRPSLVLMDIQLRGPQDGIAAADQIRRQFNVPVIFVTAFADRETLDRARITDPFDYILKPFHAVGFRARIEKALWKHQRINEFG